MDMPIPISAAETVSQGVNWETIIAFGAGAAVAIAAGFFPVWWDKHEQRRALRLAIRADISSMTNQESTKAMMEYLEESLAHWDDESKSESVMYVSLKNRVPLPIFEANLDKLGLLGPLLVGEVVEFYDLVNEVEMHFNMYNDMEPIDLKTCMEKDLMGLKKIIKLGESLISRM